MSDIATQIGQQLLHKIKQEIEQQQGFIPFSRFMELALYTPGLGYYAAGSIKFGKSGDFITAPEISPLFGRCLAHAVAPVLQQTQGAILELGAGSGRMAHDVLTELARLGLHPSYSILERSADLRQRQQECLARFGEQVLWLDTPPQQPWRGALLANEVIDALPVDRFIIQNHTPYHYGVGWGADGLTWQQGGPWHNFPLQDQLEQFADGYCSEICSMLLAWLHAVTEQMERGVAWWIDYGYPQREYYLPHRKEGTVQAYARHRVYNDVLTDPGLRDITAHVNFTALADAALDCDLDILGYTNQTFFLQDCGLETLLSAYDPNNLLQWLPIAQQVRTLCSPTEMGEHFHVMALGRNWNDPVIGFAQNDRIDRL